MKHRLTGLLVLFVLAPLASADPRPWTFLTDVYREGKGNVEFEQWVTWKGHKENESGYNRFDFREEIEFGATDWLDIGLYLPKWRYEDTRSHTGTRFDGIGAEFIAYLSKPTDAVGLALYGEFTIGENALKFEQKVILQKDVGNWSLGYNLVFETEIEREKENGHTVNEVEGVLKNVLGVSYRLTPQFRLGAELIVESVYEDWSHYEGTTIWFGPAFNYVGGAIGKTGAQWWFTITPTFQLTDQSGEPDFVVRSIVGIEF